MAGDEPVVDPAGTWTGHAGESVGGWMAQVVGAVSVASLMHGSVAVIVLVLVVLVPVEQAVVKSVTLLLLPLPLLP